MTTKNITNEGNKTPSLWSVFREELVNGSVFPSLNTAYSVSKTDQEDVPIQRAFFPSGAKALCGKSLLHVWAVGSFIATFINSTDAKYVLAFLTNWTLLVTIFYMILSLLATVAATCSLSWATSDTQQKSRLRNFFVRALSSLFTVAAVQGILVMLFWVAPQGAWTEPFNTVIKHGPLSLLVLVDGLVLNAIPVPARAIVFVWMFQCLYVLWTGIFSIFDLMNPFTMTMDMDGAIYEGIVNWRLYPGKTTLAGLTIFFVLTPVIFGLVWTMSYYSRRMRLSKGKADRQDMTEQPTDSMDETETDLWNENALELQGSNLDVPVEAEEIDESEIRLDVEAGVPLKESSIIPTDYEV